MFGKRFDGPGATLTLGMKGNGFPYGDSIDVAEGFGNTLEYNDVNEMTIDKNFKKSVVSPPFSTHSI